MKKFIGYEKGINLGGWLSQCCHTVEHYDTFITEKDFSVLASWGIDHIRLPIDYNLVEDEAGAELPEGMKYIGRAVEWCGKYGMNMVLDLHKTAGYSFDNAENESGFFEDAALQERFCRLWERLARHFGQYHNRIAFELLNEVTDSSYSKAWNKVAGECIRRIRCIAPDVYILVGGYNYNCIEAIADLEIPCDDKIVYNFHCYEPIIFTHQSASWVEGMPSDFRIAYPASVSTYADAYRQFPLKLVDLVTNAPVATVGTEFFDALFAKAVRIAEERNTTLYCGEYGVIETADRESTVRWYEAIHTAFRKYGIGRAAWSYKEMDFGLVDHGMIEALKMYL